MSGVEIRVSYIGHKSEGIEGFCLTTTPNQAFAHWCMGVCTGRRFLLRKVHASGSETH